MSVCPECGRKATVRVTDGSGGCWGCNPPDFDRHVLVERLIGDRKYHLPESRLADLEHVLRTFAYEPKSRTFEDQWDTGMCGSPPMVKTAVMKRAVQAEVFLRVRCEAIPSSNVQEIARYEQLLELKRQRAAADSEKSA